MATTQHPIPLLLPRSACDDHGLLDEAKKLGYHIVSYEDFYAACAGDGSVDHLLFSQSNAKDLPPYGLLYKMPYDDPAAVTTTLFELGMLRSPIPLFWLESFKTKGDFQLLGGLAEDLPLIPCILDVGISQGPLRDRGILWFFSRLCRTDISVSEDDIEEWRVSFAVCRIAKLVICSGEQRAIMSACSNVVAKDAREFRRAKLDPLRLDFAGDPAASDLNALLAFVDTLEALVLPTTVITFSVSPDEMEGMKEPWIALATFWGEAPSS